MNDDSVLSVAVYGAITVALLLIVLGIGLIGVKIAETCCNPPTMAETQSLLDVV